MWSHCGLILGIKAWNWCKRHRCVEWFIKPFPIIFTCEEKPQPLHWTLMFLLLLEFWTLALHKAAQGAKKEHLGNVSWHGAANDCVMTVMLCLLLCRSLHVHRGVSSASHRRQSQTEVVCHCQHYPADLCQLLVPHEWHTDWHPQRLPQCQWTKPAAHLDIAWSVCLPPSPKFSTHFRHFISKFE